MPILFFEKLLDKSKPFRGTGEMICYTCCPAPFVFNEHRRETVKTHENYLPYDTNNNPDLNCVTCGENLPVRIVVEMTMTRSAANNFRRQRRLLSQLIQVETDDDRHELLLGLESLCDSLADDFAKAGIKEALLCLESLPSVGSVVDCRDPETDKTETLTIKAVEWSSHEDCCDQLIKITDTNDSITFRHLEDLSLV